MKAYPVHEKITSFGVRDFAQDSEEVSRNICHLVRKGLFLCSQETNFVLRISTTIGIAANKFFH
jgi:hypothetical protein